MNNGHLLCFIAPLFFQHVLPVFPHILIWVSSYFSMSVVFGYLFCCEKTWNEDLVIIVVMFRTYGLFDFIASSWHDLFVAITSVSMYIINMLLVRFRHSL